MKQQNLIRFNLLLAIAIGIAACNKNEPVEPEIDTSEAQQLILEDNLFKANINEITLEAAILAFGPSAKSGMLDNLCNVNIDSIAQVGDSTFIYATFKGENCSGTRTRYGRMVIHRKTATNWIQAGTSIIIEVTDYSITNLASNKTMVLNGKITSQNVSGGNIVLVGLQHPSVIHRSEGYMHALFPDGSTRLWHHARQQIYSHSFNNLIITEDGIGEVDGYKRLICWGTLRNGQKFYNQISEPVIRKRECHFKPFSGIQMHIIPQNEMTVTSTFGFNENNKPVNAGKCPMRLRFQWQKQNKSGILFLPLE